jgi:PKD repeat protein
MKTRLSLLIVLALLAVPFATAVARADGLATGGIIGSGGEDNVRVRMLVGEPDIDVDPLSLSATVCLDGSEIQTLQVCNLGDAELTWSASEDVEWLTVSPMAGTLGPSLCEQVTVKLDSAGLWPDSFFDSFYVDSNDPDEPQVTVSAELTVPGVEAALFTWEPPEPLVGEDILFVAVVQGSGTIDYSWDFGDDSPGGHGSAVTHAYAAPGEYLVTLCDSALVQRTVTVAGLPEPDIDLHPTSLTGRVCGDGSDWQVLQVCNLGGADLTWSAAEELEWLTVSPLEGTVAPGDCASLAVQFFGPGSNPFDGFIAFTSNDPDEPTVEVPVSLVVLDPPRDAGFSWDPAQPLVNQDITFQGWAQGSAPLDYAWDFGDGGVGAGSVVTHAYAAPGDYLVTLTVSNDCDSVQVQRTVTVAGLQRMHVASIKMGYQYDESGVRRVIAVVKIVDAGGRPVSGAAVDGEWRLPYGQLRDQTQNTNAAGTARFMWRVIRFGTYQVCVLDVTKSGLAYDPDQNAETCDSITVPIQTR